MALSTDLSADENPQMKQIRVLENQLDKIMIKYNEAISIKKTYAVIFKRLSDERVTYEQNLTQIEKALANKNTDFEKLIAMSKEAAIAREVANRKLHSYKKNPGAPGA